MLGELAELTELVGALGVPLGVFMLLDAFGELILLAEPGALRTPGALPIAIELLTGVLNVGDDLKLEAEPAPTLADLRVTSR